MENLDSSACLPKCSLVDLLAKKADERMGTDFDYLGQLARFRERVRQDIEQIKLLFPEYTPHDENYHLPPLFHLAADLLGPTLKQLNATELFLLACALYGHDWGMAISELEKEALCASAPPQRIDAYALSWEQIEFAGLCMTTATLSMPTLA